MAGFQQLSGWYSDRQWFASLCSLYATGSPEVSGQHGAGVACSVPAIYFPVLDHPGCPAKQLLRWTVIPNHQKSNNVVLQK